MTAFICLAWFADFLGGHIIQKEKISLCCYFMVNAAQLQ